MLDSPFAIEQFLIFFQKHNLFGFQRFGQPTRRQPTLCQQRRSIFNLFSSVFRIYKLGERSTRVLFLGQRSAVGWWLIVWKGVFLIGHRSVDRLNGRKTVVVVTVWFGLLNGKRPELLPIVHPFRKFFIVLGHFIRVCRLLVAINRSQCNAHCRWD